MEYVFKEEVKPHKKLFDEIIEEIRPNIKKEGITYTYRLVGSGKRNLVVRHHNKGFDCDYQIIIKKNKNKINEEDLKKLFIKEFDKAVTKRDFKNCEDSARAITIKKVDFENSKILQAYDVVILDEREDGFYILTNHKKEKYYDYSPLPDTSKHSENAKKIKGAEMWNYLRKIYLAKKENNTEDKKSFLLYNEAVNETIVHFDIV